LITDDVVSVKTTMRYAIGYVTGVIDPHLHKERFFVPTVLTGYTSPELAAFF